MYAQFSKFLAIALLAMVILGGTACQEDTPKNDPPPKPATPPATVNIPAFQADSAYQYIAKQVSCTRVLGSEGHKACREWLVAQLKATGASVIEQSFTAAVYTGKKFPAANIIAQFNPDVSDRILLAAHWDTRHIADSPLNDTRQDEPILGADDGGSGVGVLLELARLLQQQPVGIGVDIVLFDAEDYGESGGAPETYCLGSQYWSNNIHTPYKHRFGILLDMVGQKRSFPH
ncbi:MAG: M28 family peptidase [Saprospiraceae bacterium]